ncbi:hypothetical protein CMK10_04245 [Candidatus Poribacteria bacterium]|nr:hypothetical protein [Candidatus Poribacteria bacterium]MBT19322.1 hypothetical protein [Candidatus Poribacteria bacterium]
MVSNKERKLSLCLVALVLILSSWSISNAQVKLTDNLSLSGFLDMSAGTSLVEDESTEANTAFDQFELDFHFANDKVSARVDIDSTSTSSEVSRLIGLEQAHVSYAFSDKFSITAGRFLSCIGFEAAEPADMYQYSWSQGIPYPGYQDGVAINFTLNDQVGIYASMVESVWGNPMSSSLNLPSFEAQVALTPIDKLTTKIGFAGDVLSNGAGTEYLQSEVNAWAQFDVADNFFVAAEFDLLGNWDAIAKDGNLRPEGDSGMHFLGMANYGLTDKVAVTARFSGYKVGDGDLETEVTLSPSYTFTDSWGGLVELRQTLADADGNSRTDIAIETIYTF